MRQFFCFNRTYNDMATLLFNPQEAAIHQLFHQDGEWAPPSGAPGRVGTTLSSWRLSVRVFLVRYL